MGRDTNTGARGVRAPGVRMSIWSGAAVALLTAAALVWSSARGAAPDPGTPEGVVRSYLTAVIEGRSGEALSLLSDRLQRECPREMRYLRDVPYRVEWLGTALDGPAAYVDVRVTEGRWFDRRENEYHFTLVSEGGEWRITSQEWPWRRCSEERLDWGAE